LWNTRAFGTTLGDMASHIKTWYDPSHSHPPAAPPVPNANNAANAAQQQTDQLRQRRGLLANIYAGGQQNAAPPAVGKTQLGT
jgi:hypothetical protein